MVDPVENIPVVRQCELLAVGRSGLYYRPWRDEHAAAFEERLLNAIDQLYERVPESWALL